MDDLPQIQVALPDADEGQPYASGGRRRVRHSMARLATFCAMMSWVVIGVVPVVVAICALS